MDEDNDQILPEDIEEEINYLYEVYRLDMLKEGRQLVLDGMNHLENEVRRVEELDNL